MRYEYYTSIRPEGQENNENAQSGFGQDMKHASHSRELLQFLSYLCYYRLQ
jgi:hypothetical protein